MVKIKFKIEKVTLFTVLLSLCLILCGCKKHAINIQHENAVQRTLHSFEKQIEKKDVIKKSSGIIIYKDNSYQDNSINKKNIRFGPKNPDFDIKLKY